MLQSIATAVLKVRTHRPGELSAFAYPESTKGQGRTGTQPAPPSLQYLFISDSVMGKVCPEVARWGLLLQTAEPVAFLCAYLRTGHCRNITTYWEKSRSRLLSDK